jgi:phosphopantetheine adenylyltransferase
VTDLVMSGTGVKAPEPPVLAPRLRGSAPRSILVHVEFLEWLESSDAQLQFKKKARHHLQCLLAFGHAKGSKSVLGAAKGWLRAALGGSGGFQFYMWYATHATSVGKGFGLGDDEILVRIVRHHDETSQALNPGARSDYVVMSAADMSVTATEDAVYLDTQRLVVGQGASSVQFVKGYPGSGKTTSLFLSYLHARPGRALYLTHSGSLADSAQQFFRAFSPEDVTVEVMSFSDLLDDLRDDPPGTNSILTPSDGAERMMRMLESNNNKWHQLVGDRMDDWYAELHAYAAGRSLPVEFRKLAASSTPLLSGDDYARLRRPEIGDEADKIAQVLNHLRTLADVTELFCGPLRARELLMDQFVPPPPRLENLATVLVDEVQDLTAVEILLILNVVSRSANASGRFPRVVFAGDESQTVRPSGFDWPTLSDLISKIFGSHASNSDSINLDQNVRSSQQIATFVEATRDQYLKFLKRDRPGGIQYTRSNDAVHGRLMYCLLDGDGDMAKLGELMDELSRSVIVYPGHRLPQGLPQQLLDRTRTSNEVKGLDFDTVVLMDAGTRQEELDALLARQDGRPASAVVARVLADQYRVAASRATENLLLVDRGSTSHQPAIEALSRKAGLESLEIVTIDDVATLLSADLDPEEVIRDLHQEVRRTIADDPRRARSRYRSARRQLERAARGQELAPELLEQDRKLCALTAAALILHDRDLAASDRKEYEDQVRQNLEGEQLSAVDALFDLQTTGKPVLNETTTRALTLSADALKLVALHLPELSRLQVRQLRRWIDQMVDDVSPAATRLKESQAAEAVVAVTGALAAEFPDYRETCDRILIRWSGLAATQKRFSDSLELLKRVAVRQPILEADCHAGLLQYREASDAYAIGGDHRRAVLMARELGDHQLALDRASAGDQALIDETMWVSRLMQASDPLPDHNVALTEAERARLTRHTNSPKAR